MSPRAAVEAAWQRAVAARQTEIGVAVPLGRPGQRRACAGAAEAAAAQAQSLKQSADDVERRMRAGDPARADALAAQAKLLAASALKTDLQQRLPAARSRWALMTVLSAAPDLRADAATDVPVRAHPEAQFVSC